MFHFTLTFGVVWLYYENLYTYYMMFLLQISLPFCVVCLVCAWISLLQRSPNRCE